MSVTKSYYKIQIPSKPYIVKYLQKLYGDPIIFTTDNYFGTTLIGYLTKQFYLRKNQTIVFKKFDEFKSQLVVSLPYWWMKNKKFGVDIPKDNVIFLNKHFEERFTEDLVRYCYAMQIMNVEIQEAIYLFCEQFNIEIDIDISFDGLKRKEYRARMEMKGIYNHIPKHHAKEPKQRPEVLQPPPPPNAAVQLCIL